MSNNFHLQLYRGTTAQNDAYTGLSGEVTVDTTLSKLRLHDGSTAGGVEIGGMPVGSIIPYAGTTIPAGYLLCDGSAISRTTYSALFASIGTTYGEGDGNSTFNLPIPNDFPSSLVGSAENLILTEGQEMTAPGNGWIKFIGRVITSSNWLNIEAQMGGAFSEVNVNSFIDHIFRVNKGDKFTLKYGTTNFIDITYQFIWDSGTRCIIKY